MTVWLFRSVTLAAAGMLAFATPVDMPWLSYAVFAVVAVLIVERPGWRDILLCLLFVIGSGAIRLMAHGIVAPGAGLVDLGVVSIATLFNRMVVADSSDKPSRRTALLIAALTPTLALVSGIVNAIVSHLRPLTYDTTLFAIDHSLGFDPSFASGRLIAIVPAVWPLCVFFYLSLPVGLVLAYVNTQGRPAGFGWLKQVVAAAMLGAMLYWLVPAVGPLVAFPSYPMSPASTAGSGLMAFSQTYPRNCVPSLHFAWVLLMLLNARGTLARLIAIVFGLFTAVATIGSGEHYLIDLVIATPFAVGIYRWFDARTVVICSTLVIAWLTAILMDWKPHGPLEASLAMVVTVTIPFLWPRLGR